MKKKGAAPTISGERGPPKTLRVVCREEGLVCAYDGIAQAPFMGIDEAELRRHRDTERIGNTIPSVGRRDAKGLRYMRTLTIPKSSAPGEEPSKT